MKLSLDELSELLRGKKYATYVAARCPFPDHEDSRPSLLAFADGRFMCKGCGRTGTHYELAQQAGKGGGFVVEAEPPPTLPAMLADQDQLCEDAHYALMRNPGLGLYYKERGITAPVIKTAGLGIWQGWCTIPIYSWHSGFTGMFLRRAGGAGSRFYQPRGQAGMLYCPDWSRIKGTKHVYVVFGMFDALALAVLKEPVFTSTAGQDSFRTEWLDNLPRYVSIYIVPDVREEPAAMKLAGRLDGRAKVLRLPYPDRMKDPADYLKVGKGGLLKKHLARMLQV